MMDRRGAARAAVDRFQEYAYTFRSVLADVHFDVVGRRRPRAQPMDSGGRQPDDLRT